MNLFDIFDTCARIKLLIKKCNFPIVVVLATSRLPRRAVRLLLIDAIKALNNLREKNLCHGDIKPDNLFISDECRLIIGDLGSAKRVMDNGQKLSSLTNDGRGCITSILVLFLHLIQILLV